MVQTYQPTLMDVNEDTIPELLPIFTFLNSHQNKLYQEGYFLKLDDQDTRTFPMRPVDGPHFADIAQEENRIRTEHGPNASRSWSARCSPSGMQQS
jgi:hypothetical protein